MWWSYSGWGDGSGPVWVADWDSYRSIVFALSVCVCVVCLSGAEVNPEVGEVFNCHVHAFYVSGVCASDDGCVICECSDPKLMCDAL